MIYKHAEQEGWYYQIDDQGNKGQSWDRINRPVMYKEMREWDADGNIIEDQYTLKELAQKESEDLKNALEYQKQTCIRILDDIVHKFLPNYRKPEDVPEWQIFQDKIIVILESYKILEIPVKPFSATT